MTLTSKKVAQNQTSGNMSKSNILFLGIDSLRADHCYDHKKSYSTPNFDQLIKKGIFFNRFKDAFFLFKFFLESSVRKTLTIFLFGFFKASTTVCFPAIKNVVFFIKDRSFCQINSIFK